MAVSAHGRAEHRRCSGNWPGPFEAGKSARTELASADLVTREDLYERLHARLPRPPRRLSPYERDVLAQTSARESSAMLGLGPELRPGLVAEMLRFYDQLKRQSQRVTRFEELLDEALGKEVDLDRGARRMLEQTHLLAATFRDYERRVADSGACDEHVLREHLLAERSLSPPSSIVVTVADWIAEPNGLYVCDYDLLSRMPGIETIDLIATEATLASGFHQRLHDWLPGLEESDFQPSAAQSKPMLAVPVGFNDRFWFSSRDREEELIGVARRLKSSRRDVSKGGDEPRALDRVAVVYKQPLPYVIPRTGSLWQRRDSLSNGRHDATGRGAFFGSARPGPGFRRFVVYSCIDSRPASIAALSARGWRSDRSKERLYTRSGVERGALPG